MFINHTKNRPTIKFVGLLFIFVLFIALFSACGFSDITGIGEQNLPDSIVETTLPADSSADDSLDPNGSYTTKEDVALYLHQYGELPKNFITKQKAQELGWSGGSVDKYAPGMCIGGSNFGNYEGLLPEAKGRKFKECDIDTLGASSRGAKRIVYSNDGLIYYTDDHYESFTLLYGEE